ncbi:MAG: transcriptional regulator [Phyllobacterium sp.]|uniref:transcriptional regulator n=1 Tax=Phyllobacterium sp. TaxID=1871046 RepID=UPI0030F0A865
MADFVAVLRKTIDGLADPTPELRQRVYAKARATIEQKLATLNAPEAVSTRQKKALEDAINQIESEFKPTVEDVVPVPEPVPVAPPAPAPAPIVKSASPAAPTKTTPVAAPPFTRIGSQPDALEDFLTSHSSNGTKRVETIHDSIRADDTASKMPANFPDDRKKGRGPEEETNDDDLGITSEDRRTGDYGVYTRGPLKQTKPKRSLVPLLSALALLLVIAGAGYAGWTYRDKISAQAGAVKTWLANLTSSKPEPAKPTETAKNEPAKTPAQPTVQAPAATPSTAEPKPEPKLTQRLLPDGQEINPGPANDTPSLGEGTSVASSTPDQPAKPPAATAQQQAAGQAQQPAALPIGQKAFFYEERSGQDAGTADAGGVVWSVVQESPGNDLPPEPAIRAEVTIPDRGINLRMIIRRNGDKTLPASHLVEMIFTVPQGFAGGSIDNVSRMTFKDTEQAPGSPLVAIPAKIADNFFIVAMNDAKTAIDTNMSLMRRQSWIDIPIAYKTGRRALITLEKGLPGEKAFDDVLKSWTAKAGG